MDVLEQVKALATLEFVNTSDTPQNVTILILILILVKLLNSGHLSAVSTPLRLIKLLQSCKKPWVVPLRASQYPFQIRM